MQPVDLNFKIDMRDNSNPFGQTQDPNLQDPNKGNVSNFGNFGQSQPAQPYQGQQNPAYTDIKIEAGSNANQPFAQSQPQPVQSPGCNPIEWLRPYFNVTTLDVKQRIQMSLNPMKATFFDATKSNPDLYGPFWIYTTLIMVLAAAGNFSGMLSASASGVAFTYNYNFILTATGLIYGFGLGVPIIFTILLKFYGSNVQYINTICLYGYSLFVFVPVFILAVIPSTILQWLLIIGGTCSSTIFLLTNYATELKKYEGNTRYILLVFVGVSQFILLLVFKFYFFGSVYAGNE